MWWWFFLLSFLLVGCNLNQSQPVAQATVSADVQGLVVAWVEAGNLVVWREGETLPRRVASGGVIQPFISTTGEFVAFTRGPVGLPESLWVVDINGSTEQQLVGDGTLRGFRSGQSMIGDVQWLDGAVLYFNTFNRNALGAEPLNDLYRANARTRQVSLILPSG